MPSANRLCLCTALVAALAGSVTGCSGPNAQISRCQSEKQELLSVIEREKAKSQAATERMLALESRLDQSEKQLAQLVRPGLRGAEDAEPRMASSPARPLDPPARQETSPVREPAKSKATPPADRGSLKEMKLQGPSRTEAPGSALAALAQRDPRLKYDPESRTARFQIDVPFAADAADLTAEGRRKLDELSAWLKSREASDLKVLVSGYSSGMRKAPAGADGERFGSDRELAAARAMAVADYLDSHGIKDDRLAVVGSGSKRSSSGAGAVEIVLAEPDAAVAGVWSASAVRR